MSEVIFQSKGACTRASDRQSTITNPLFKWESLLGRTGLIFKLGQTHVHLYLQPLLKRFERGDIDPSFVISHRLMLEDPPHAYEVFMKRRPLRKSC